MLWACDRVVPRWKVIVQLLMFEHQKWEKFGKKGAFCCSLLLEKEVTQYPFCTFSPKGLCLRAFSPLKKPRSHLLSQVKDAKKAKNKERG